MFCACFATIKPVSYTHLDVYKRQIYELHNGAELLQSELMDFQTHLYMLGEMEQYLREIGFKTVAVYSSFRKEPAAGNTDEMFLYECTL